MNRVVAKVQEAQLRKDLPEFRPGDTVRVHVRLKEAEGEKERIQPFEGVVIGKRGRLAGASFTVRRVSFGIGVERIFPVNSPTISSVEVVNQGRVRRAVLARRIREHALAWAVAEVDAQRIDAWNIYQASRQAMAEALAQLAIPPDYLLIDALRLDLPVEQKPLIKGDARSVSIAAASILAKVTRDLILGEWDKIYPHYGLARNKGYSTPDHMEALRIFGPTPQHRFSFAPVREASCWAAGATQAPLPLAASPVPR